MPGELERGIWFVGHGPGYQKSQSRFVEKATRSLREEDDDDEIQGYLEDVWEILESF
jgi:hypothetical protein